MGDNVGFETFEEEDTINEPPSAFICTEEAECKWHSILVEVSNQ